jgi:methylmalonyl-CoA mutase
MVSSSTVRIITAASLFDGHDAAINIMRRIMQAKGAEVIHLGHNRAAQEIVEAAIQEDAHAIAITSYQGGHVEFFKYIFDLLHQNGCGHIKIFGGGGGTILPTEIEELHAYGITRIYSPDDGRHMGLEGMIHDVIDKAADALPKGVEKANQQLKTSDWKTIATLISTAERGEKLPDVIKNSTNNPPVLGITGTGGAGKSSVTDEIVRRYLTAYENKTIAIISVDPSKKKTGGALLGDRIRMNAIFNPRVYMRSLATRESDKALSAYVQEAIDVCKAAGFDMIIIESAGVGQSDASILDYCNVSLYVMTPEYGAASQLEKINMLDYADVIAINKFDKAGALDAYKDVCKQYKRNHTLFQAKDEELPVVGTMASKFNDAGINRLFGLLIKAIHSKQGTSFGEMKESEYSGEVSSVIIPPARVRYLSEIAESIEQYDTWVNEQSDIARKLYQLKGAMAILNEK